MQLLHRLPFYLSLALVAALPAVAQQPAQQPHQQPTAVLEQAPLQPASKTIQLDVVVTPKSGVPVTGLSEKDFTVFDNGKPQTITSFQAEDSSREPIEVVLLIDTVNPGFSIVSYERTEVDKFLQANGGHLARPMSLAILTDKGARVQPGFTTDGKALSDSLDRQTLGLRQITRSTGFYGAGERLDISLKALQQVATYEARQPGRKIILWLSPGWPLLQGTQGNLTGGQAKGIFGEIVSISNLLRQTRTTLYNVNPLGANENLLNTFAYQPFVNGVSKPGDANYGNLALQVIATQSGGLVLSSSDVNGMLQNCLKDITSYYRLTFEPPPSERQDIYHRLDVKVAQPGLTARTRTGYYTQP